MSITKSTTSVITQFTCARSAFAGYLRSASAFFHAASFQPLSLVGPIFATTLSAAPAGSSPDENERPDLVRKSFALSQSLYLDHGPTKMWKLQSFACTVIGFAFAKVSSAGFT